MFCYLHVSAYCLRHLYILGVNRVLGILTQNKLRKKLSCDFSLFFSFLINSLQKSILYSILELLHFLPNRNFFFFFLFLRETLVDSLNKN